LGRKKIERWEDKNNQPHQLHEAATWPKGPQSYFYLTKTLKKFFNLLLIYYPGEALVALAKLRLIKTNISRSRKAEAATRPKGPEKN
jgi:hypothetical protein